MRGKIYGLGINDANYKLHTRVMKKGKVVIESCPYYTAWRGMLVRSYCPLWLKAHPTYKDCTVCDEWLTFSNFKAWMETQDYKDKELDKDLLSGRVKCYSPENCVFIDRSLNRFIIESDASRGLWPIGVYWNKQNGKFRAVCGNQFTGEQEYLGLFTCPIEAHRAWLKRKLELARLIAEQQNDPRVAEALVRRYENYSIVSEY